MSNIPPRVIRTPKPSDLAPKIEKPVNKQKGERHLGRKATALGGVALAGFVGYGLLKAQSWNDRLDSFHKAEAIALTNDTRAPGALSQRVIVLKSGVKFRSTPNSIDDSAFDLNVAGHHLMSGNTTGTVPDGQELVVAKPRVFLDKGGSTWLGFVTANGSISSKQKTPDAVADDMMWVNASKLNGDKQIEMSNSKNSQLTPLTVTELDKFLQTSKLDEHGQYMSDKGNPIAWSPGLQPAGTYELNHQVDNA